MTRGEFALQIVGEVRRSKLLQWAIWAAALSVLFLSLIQVPLIIDKFREPYIIETATMVTERIKPGDSVIVSYKAIRRRTCRVDYDRVIIRQGDGKLLYRDRTPGGGNEEDSPSVLIDALTIPHDAEPGTYILYTTVSNECRDGLHTIAGPPLQFTIVRP